MKLFQLIVWNTKFLTTMDDWVRLVTMTMAALLLASWLNLSGLAFTALIVIGVAIDIHDIVEKAMQGKPIV